MVASIIFVVFSALMCAPSFNDETEGWEVFGCIVIGLPSGVLIGQATKYFKLYEYWAVRSITSSGITSPATVIIQGLGIGMVSCVAPVLILVATILSCK